MRYLLNHVIRGCKNNGILDFYVSPLVPSEAMVSSVFSHVWGAHSDQSFGAVPRYSDERRCALEAIY